MKRFLYTLLICVFFIAALSPSASYAEEDEPALPEQVLPESWPNGPEINADSAIVMDVSTGLILYAKDMYTKRYPASITKILTTLVALENSQLNETVTVSYEAEWYVSKTSSRMGLVEGEQLTMEEALYGIMLESANEATYAVGEHIGGSVAKYIKMMNSKAKELGCVNSHFANTHGLHDDEHYTCCYDMALISQAAYNNPTFRKITGTSSYAMPSTNKNPERLMINHHKFITKEMPYDYAVGGKTGATTQANYTLVTYAKKNGMTLISVVMHADTWDNVYADSATVLDFAFDNFSIYNIEGTELAATDTFPSLFADTLQFTDKNSSILRLSDNASVILPNGISYENASPSISFELPDELEHGDNIIGKITYTFEGVTVSQANIIYYNNRTPITNKVFKSSWPRFLIPVDVAFSAPETETIIVSDDLNTLPVPASSIILKSASEEKSDLRPLLLAIIAFLVTFSVGAFFVLRKRRHSRYM